MAFHRNKSAKSGASFFVRWLGAYGGRGNTLKEMLQFEIERKTEFACERITRGQRMSDIPSSIGVLVDGSVVVRSFRGDCWSEMTANGRLKKTSSCHDKV